MDDEKGTKVRLALSDFLAEQAKTATVGTLEVIPNNDKLVKFTPWRPGAGCMCHASVMLPKSAIASVSPTGDRHLCCGKLLKVVEIEIGKDEAIPVSEVLSQMMERASGSVSHTEARGAGRPRVMNSATTGTCVCDHFLRRYCLNGKQYEDYACYDDTGAYCGQHTVETGGFCPQVGQMGLPPGTSTAFESPVLGGWYPPFSQAMTGQHLRSRSLMGTEASAAAPCAPISQCPWGCCPPWSPVACSQNGRCWCCPNLGSCYTGSCL